VIKRKPNKWEWHAAHILAVRDTDEILLEGKRPLAGPNLTWEYNIKADVKKQGIKMCIRVI
jgi:hypothetical protein